MGLDELAVALGGIGRAQLAWDCYSIGIDSTTDVATDEMVEVINRNKVRVVDRNWTAW